ncbi:MAG: hypothetical protein ACKOA8_02605, partial [Deltaproteobacteria bacterium]
MKKFSFEKGLIKVTVSVALLLSQSGLADEYDNYSNSFRTDIDKAESALSSVTSRSATGSDSLTDQLKATLERNEKVL